MKILTGLASLLLMVAAGAMAAPPPSPTLDDARAAYAALDLDEASAILDRLEKPKGRRGSAETPPSEEISAMRDRIILAQNMLERVEKVTVVDSLGVPRDDFFRAMRLHPATGRLLDIDEAARLFPVLAADSLEVIDPVFVDEAGDMALWAGYDSADSDVMRIYEAWRLADGSFTAPAALFDRPGVFGDGLQGQVYAPFLMADGMTLYFAADGPGSLGGLDIFMARRDGDRFLQPANVGMPYNSPANDYMMAIDEATGLGWWATDRNASPDSLTVYIFQPAEMRVNYPSDTPGLASLALLDDMSLVQRPDDGTRRRLAETLREALTTPRGSTAPQWAISLPDGSVVTRASQLRDRDAREMLADWLRQREQLADAEGALEKSRRAYARGDRSLASEIRRAESDVAGRRKALMKLRNDIVSCETYTRR